MLLGDAKKVKKPPAPKPHNSTVQKNSTVKEMKPGKKENLQAEQDIVIK